MNIQYSGIESDKIKNAFSEVFEEYKVLHKFKLKITQKKLGSSTMQAKPDFKFQSIFHGINEYEISIGKVVFDSDIALSSLPKDVLKGWFAHELGHVKDYTSYSVIGMAKYGIKYWLSNAFVKKVEHKADHIAIEKGFRKEIIATKKYLFLEGFISDRYLKKLSKYYMPLDSIQKNPSDTLTTVYHE